MVWNWKAKPSDRVVKLPNCPSGLVGGFSILTGEHGTGLESKSEGVRNRASVVGVAGFAAEGIKLEFKFPTKIPIYDALYGA